MADYTKEFNVKNGLAVNGNVVIDSSGVIQSGAVPSNISTHVSSTSNPHSTTAAQVGAEPSGAVSTHNSANDSHSDIRSELLSLSDDIPSDPLPREADTLEGHDASYYTTYSDTAVSNHDSSETSHSDIRASLAQTATKESPTFTGTVSGITASMVGLGNVTNESKSTMFDSPTFIGDPKAPTPLTTDNDTSIATTAYVVNRIAQDATPIAHVGTGGSAHSNASQTVAGFMSSTDKTKLDGIADGAQPGTVTSVSAGNGMSFTTISTSGAVTLGTPSTITSTSSNSTTSGTHSHAITGFSLDTHNHNTLYQPLDADLTAIAGITATAGLLKKTAENTWTLDTNTYITGNQTITLSGDVSGSGTTSIEVIVADDSHSHSDTTISSLDASKLTGTVSGDRGITSGSILSSFVGYNGTTSTAGQFDGGTATPTGTNRLNYGGYFYPTALNLVGTSDTATTATHYFVETGTDGYIRPKTLANVKDEIVVASELLTKIKTVDGSGSDLDADRLDGQHGSYYATAIHDHTGTYQPVDADLTAIAALSGTSGFLKKTAADTWILESILGLTTTYSGTLSTSWSGSQAPFSQAVTVMGIASTDEPILDVVMSGTYATDELRNTEWAYIYYAVTATDQITFYARQKPTASLPFTAKVI